MAKQRRWLAVRLSRIGSSFFGYLSRWEQESSSKLAGWLKLGVLGILVTLIGALTAHEAERRVMCYDMAFVPDIYLTEVEIDPNPTAGTDSVTVTAHATISENTSRAEKSLINEVFFVIDPDTVRYRMEPVDGKMNSYDEKVRARIPVGNFEPCTTLLHVTATAANLTPETQTHHLIISEAEEIDKDTIYSTPEIEIAPKETTEE